MDERALQIHSYRVVFDLERRIHRVDRFRVPLPYGLPLRSLAYALVALLAVLAFERLPGTEQLLAILPTPARLVLLPTAISYALTRLRLDGRSAHAAATCWLTFLTRPRQLVAFRAVSASAEISVADLAMVPNASGPAWCRGTVIGPANVVVVGVPADARDHGRGQTALRATEGPADPKVLHVGPGERLLLR